MRFGLAAQFGLGATMILVAGQAIAATEQVCWRDKKFGENRFQIAISPAKLKEPGVESVVGRILDLNIPQSEGCSGFFADPVFGVKLAEHEKILIDVINTTLSTISQCPSNAYRVEIRVDAKTLRGTASLTLLPDGTEGTNFNLVPASCIAPK